MTEAAVNGRRRGELYFAGCCLIVYTAAGVADSFEAVWQGAMGESELAAFGMGESVANYAAALDFIWLGVLARVSRHSGASQWLACAATLKMGWLTALALGLPLLAVVEALAGPILRLFGPDPGVMAIAAPYLRVHLIGLVPLELYRVAISGLQGLRHSNIFAGLWLGVAVFELASNYLAVVRLGGGAMGSGIASATRNALFAMLSCSLYFGLGGKGTAARRVVGSSVWQATLSRRDWWCFLADSGMLFVAGVADTTQTVLFSAFSSRLGAEDAACMVIVKRILVYPKVVGDACVVVAAALSASALGEGESLVPRASIDVDEAAEPLKASDEAPTEASVRPTGSVAISGLWKAAALSACCAAVVSAGFRVASKSIYTAFDSDQAVVTLMMKLDSLMCLLIVTTVLTKLVTGYCYGAHRFRELSCVSFAALVLVFLPVLIWGLHRADGLSLELLVIANLAYLATNCIGNLGVLLILDGS